MDLSHASSLSLLISSLWANTVSAMRTVRIWAFLSTSTALLWSSHCCLVPGIPQSPSHWFLVYSPLFPHTMARGVSLNLSQLTSLFSEPSYGSFQNKIQSSILDPKALNNLAPFVPSLASFLPVFPSVSHPCPLCIAPTPGPLHMLFLLLGMLFLPDNHISFPPFLKSLLTCYIFIDIFPVHFIANFNVLSLRILFSPLPHFSS